MNRIRPLISFCFLLLSLGCSQEMKPTPGNVEDIAPERASGFRDVEVVKAKRAMIVTANPLATKAGYAVLQAGGSAVDAAIAAQMMLTLVEPQSSGIGGGAFMLHYHAKTKEVAAYDGRETAPAKATPSLFLDEEGKPFPFFDAVVGGRSVGTPGTLRMLELAHKAHGKRPWASLFEAAIQRSEEGFAVSPRLNKLLSIDRFLAGETAAGALYYDAEGKALPVGAILKNADLAETLRIIADKGADGLYTGPIAESIVAAVKAHRNPGLLELKDLAGYEAKQREALEVSYKDYQVVGFPPPTSGGVTTLQIIRMLEGFDLGDDPLGATFLHVLAEAERLAYADRGLYLADADMVEVPFKELIDEGYLKERAALIDPAKAMGQATAGQPTVELQAMIQGESFEQSNTTHLCVVDAEGNIVSMTSSIENVFGSRLLVRGFLLNNQLTDFSFRPSDEQGGAIANAVAPGKRPRSSMAPVLVFGADGDPVLALGSPGGSRIIGYVAQTILHVLAFDLDIQEAIELPHVVNRNGKTEIEDHSDYDERLTNLARELTALGHEIKRGEMNSGLHGIVFTKDGLEGGVDPRREGLALGE